MVTNAMAQLQEQGNRELGYCLGAVCWDVTNGDTELLCGSDIHHVIAGGQAANQSDTWASTKNLSVEGDLVGDDDFVIADAGNGFFGRGSWVYCQISELDQTVPAQVAGIYRFAVKNDDVHKTPP
jgi:hypothetical protein